MKASYRMRGAEAVVSPSMFAGRNALVKERIGKKYRIREIDVPLRTLRTRSEARLLHRAKLAGVPCPTVFYVDKFELWMSRIDGKRPEMDAALAKEAGRLLAKLHSAGIIHGDFTPANLLLSSKGGRRKLSVIDFGLGFSSMDLEDRAVDAFTFLKSVEPRLHPAFWNGYGKGPKVPAKIEEIKGRMRYS